MMKQITDRLKEYAIVPVIAIEEIENVLPLADSLIEGGLPLIEITFRTKIAPDAIKKLRKERSSMLIGAGTVLTVDELKMAIDSGASFGVAPGFNPKIVEMALTENFPFMPGVLTPTDIDAALSFGLHVLKFFPAEAAGGVKYLQNISAPYTHKGVRFIPTGGINTENIKEYINLNVVLAVGGTWIAKQSDIEAERWNMIAENCRIAKTLITGSE